ncbi:MAG: methyltransferase domain-containing protein [Ignavibacteria bacterium]|nr:methyltransferase domain-containing protein [Ignavibacteria bacterium]
MSSDLFSGGEAAHRFETLYTSHKVIARRKRALEILAPRTGEHGLDIGFGPGLFTSEIAEMVGPGGSVAGIDASASMFALATARCAPYPWVSLQIAEATALPFPDAGFDVGLASNVYGYVVDIGAALHELYRVLRPGGRALVMDFEWDSLVWHASDSARMNSIISAWKGKFDDPYFARTLRPRLHHAGFLQDHVESIAMFCTEIDPYVQAVTSLIGAAVIGSNGITQKEVDAWVADLARLAAQDEYFFSLNQYLFLVRKPG